MNAVNEKFGQTAVRIDLGENWTDIRTQVRKICTDFPGSYWRGLEDEQAYPTDFVQALTESGYLSALIPEAYGGAGLPLGAAAAILEEIHANGCNAGACHAQMYIMGTLLRHGSPLQKEQYLPQIASGKLRLQAFGVTEPTSGTDTTQLKTRAQRDGDHYVVNGQKVWTSGAHYSDWGILLVRTNPDVPKHKGLTMFFVDMKSPGVEVRPIHQMSGGSNFNEVYFTDVRIPHAQLLGGEGNGWTVALVTLMNERLAVGGGYGPDYKEMMEFARTAAGPSGGALLQDSGFRQKLADWVVRAEGYRLGKFRTMTALSKGQTPGPESSIGKVITANQLQDISNAGIEAQDHYGVIADQELSPLEAIFQQSYMWAPGLRIAGGTDEILKNIIAERVLGLPGDVRVDKDVAFKDLPTGR